MKQTGKIKLIDEHKRVLEALAQQNSLSRSQLTIGPLRHLDQSRRVRRMNELQRWKLVEEFTKKPPRGATAYFYRLTDAGRQAYQATAA